MTDLGTLSGGGNGQALGINISGQVVGWSDSSSGYEHAFLYGNGAMTDLGILLGADINSAALSINSSGEVVGNSGGPLFAFGVTPMVGPLGPGVGAIHPFLYSNGAMTDLNSLLPASSGWILINAAAINDHGQITGYGDFGGYGRGYESAYLLTPDSYLLQPGKNLGGPTQGSCTAWTHDPVNVTTGDNYQSQVDYQGKGAFPLRFVRDYNSQASTFGPLGTDWTYSYSQHIQLTSSTTADVVRSSGKIYSFTLSNGTWTSDADVNGKLTEQTDSSGNPTGWQYTNSKDQVEAYNAIGQLLSITDRSGLTQTMTYSTSNTPTSVAPGPGYLITVTDPYGRTLSFTYDSQGRVSTLQDPAGQTYTYGYDTNNNLVSVTYPDTHQRLYLYNEQAETGNTNLPNALTGITDEDGNRYATFTYNSQGVGTSTTHAGDAGLVNLTYNASNTAVTEPLGAVDTYGFSVILGVGKVSSLSWPCVKCGASQADTTNQLSYGYDANGNVNSVTDIPGDSSTAENAAYTWDTTRNLLQTDTQANGTAQQVTTQTTWDPNYRLPDKIVAGITPGTPNGLKETDYTYDSHGNVIQKTEKDLVNTTLPIRTWNTAYSYSTSVPGATLSKTVTDPLGHVTTYTYYAPDATCSGSAPLGCRGQLESVANALSQTTTVNTYDADGRPLTLTDPNGLVTTLTYTPRGWVKSITVGSETTSYQYDNAGNLILVTRPDGSHIGYGYDAAHRLTSIKLEDNNQTVVGTMVYTLDNAGDVVKTQILDASGSVNYTHSDLYDSLARLYQDIGAVNQTATDTRDAHNNLTSYEDPRTDITTYGYDALNRLIQVTAADGGVTQYGYDGLDQITSVTDPLTQTTQYTKDAFGDTLKTVSPDTGTTTYTYDADGNVLTRTDAQGNTTTYQYDALNRLVSKSSSLSGTPKYTYHYDGSTNGIGKLYYIHENGKFSSYFSYDSQGRLNYRLDTNPEETRFNWSTYTYRPGGALASITYATGGVVKYQYDAEGRVDGVTYTPPNSTTALTLASNFVYHPFGGPQSYYFGNNTMYLESLNQDYRPEVVINGPYAKAPSYDPAGDVIFLGDIDNTTQSFTYDPVGRLLTATNTEPSSYGSLAYTYDKNGNRQSATQNGTTIPYTYSPKGSNWLYQAGGEYRLKNTDGNTAFGTTPGFLGYDGYERLNQSSNQGTTYAYDGLGERLEKTVNGNVTTFGYDPQGRLIFEEDPAGNTHAYVWMDGKLLARIDNGTTIYYIHTDALGTVHAMTDASGNVVWRAHYTPFGQAIIVKQTITNNLRQPGQYYDQETGLAYNLNRDYDASLGRYVQADPLGLAAGDNPYLYVNGNPLSYTDPTGKNPVLIGAGIAVVTAGIVYGVTPGTPQEKLSAVADFFTGFGIAVAPEFFAPEEGASLVARLGGLIFGTSTDAALDAKTVGQVVTPNAPKGGTCPTK